MIMKMMVITESMTLNLPSDWDPSDNIVWCWGAGGNGMNDAGAPFLTGGGGGGGGGFKEALNIGLTAGDLIAISVGIGGNSGPFVPGNTTVRDANDTKVVDVLTDTPLCLTKSGYNCQSQAGAVGGGGAAGSHSESNTGGDSQSAGGGGAGGGAAGPALGHFTLPAGPRLNMYGTHGGGSTFAFSSKGGGAGGGGQGDFRWPEDTDATNGGSSTNATGATGGLGFLGTGGGAGSNTLLVPGSDGTSNTGGGGGGGYGPGLIGGAQNQGTNGGNGANWDYILTLPIGEWISPAPFTWELSSDGRYAILSNETVPAGGGGAGGGAYGGSGGAGGFPGGGGGGAADSFNPPGIGGPGADGLVLIFYEGSASPVVGVQASVRWI